MAANKNGTGSGLKKELSLLQLTIIGIVGAVGTGVLFSAAGMAGDAGPASVISWIIGGLMYASVGYTYVELSRTWPEAGGPTRYSLYTHGRFTNLINAFNDLIWYLFIPPVEALAVVEGLNFLFPTLIAASGAPTLLGAVLGVILLMFFIPFNYFGVKAFGKSTSIFGIIKLVFYLLVGFGIIAIFFNAKNFFGYSGGFAPFGAAGLFLAIPLAMFAYGGIRVVPDYAEEVKNKNILPKAIGYTVLGQTLIYILFSMALIGGIAWGVNGLPAAGNWVGVGQIVGNPFIILSNALHNSVLLVLVLIVGIIGPFVTGYVYIGGGSRILFAMGRSRIMNNIVTDITRHSIPYWSIIIFAIVGAVVAFIAAPLPSIYGLITDAVVGGYLGFAVNPVALIVSRRQNSVEHRYKFANIIAPIAFISAALIAFWSGWPSVPYAVLILTIALIIFAIAFKVKEHFINSLWYIFFIAFILLMTYIGDVGALSILNFYVATVVVVLVAGIIFFPWGVYSGLKKPFIMK